MSKGLRILTVGNIYPPHDFGGGYELTWRSSVAHLRRSGHDVRVLASNFLCPGLDPVAEFATQVHRELEWYWRDHAFRRRGLRERIAIERHNAGVIERHLEEFSPQVVSWWGMGGMSLSLIERVRRAGLPAVGVVGDEWMVWGPRADAWTKPFRGRRSLGAIGERLTGLPTRPDFPAAATWLFNSEHVRHRVTEAVGPLRSTAVLHPGIDDRLFRRAPECPWQWRLLYLGRLDARKGVMTLLEALPLLPEAASVLLQGSGDEAYVASLRARCRELRIESRVAFARAPRDHLPTVFAKADAVIFPVIWDEPWGLVPLEAMAVGRPVVATGTGGSSEYLRHGENCLLFEPRDSRQALADALFRLSSDPPLRTRLRANGFRTAARFTENGYNAGIESALIAAVLQGETHTPQ